MKVIVITVMMIIGKVVVAQMVGMIHQSMTDGMIQMIGV